VAGVDESGLEGIPSPAVLAWPGVFSVALNNDNRFANSLAINVSLTAPSGSGSVRLSNTPDLTSRPWMAYSASKSWELEPGDGDKTVYAQFRDVSGATSLGQISDEIILDTRAVIDSVRMTTEETVVTAGSIVHFLVGTGESDGSATVEVSGSTIACFDDGTHGDAVSADGEYQRSWLVPTDADFEDAMVTARFVDRAGNQAEQQAAPNRLTVRQAPEPVNLFAFPDSPSRIAVSWTQSTADDFEFYRLFRDDSPDVNDQSTLIFSSTSRTATAYADTGRESSAVYYYSVWVYDRTGLSTPSAVVAALTPVNTAPEPVIVSQPLDLGGSSLRITWSQSNEEDFASYRIYRSEVNQQSGADLLSILSSRTTTQYEDRSLDLENSSYYYWVAVYDRGGLSAFSDVVSWEPPGAEAPDPVTLAIPQELDTSWASIRLTWTRSQAENFESYRVYRSEDSRLDAGETPTAILNSASSTEYLDSNGDFKNNTYYYWVRVYDLDGRYSQSDSVIWKP